MVRPNLRSFNGGRLTRLLTLKMGDFHFTFPASNPDMVRHDPDAGKALDLIGDFPFFLADVRKTEKVDITVPHDHLKPGFNSFGVDGAMDGFFHLMVFEGGRLKWCHDGPLFQRRWTHFFSLHVSTGRAGFQYDLRP